MRYPGGKNGEGIVQRIINQIPPHSEFVEPFGGSAAVCRALRKAKWSVVIDRDPGAIAGLTGGVLPAGVNVICGDGISWMERNVLGPSAVVYADPPYLLSTRSHRRIYRCELLEADHVRLLDVLTSTRAKVLLSGYPSALYSQRLLGWRSIEYRVMTRGGVRTECLWMNFPEPMELHDYRYLGGNFREREKIRRQQRRWSERLNRMNRLQRLALLSTIAESGDGCRRE